MKSLKCFLSALLQPWSVRRASPSRTTWPWRSSSSAPTPSRWRRSRPTTADSGTQSRPHPAAPTLAPGIHFTFLKGEVQPPRCVSPHRAEEHASAALSLFPFERHSQGLGCFKGESRVVNQQLGGRSQGLSPSLRNALWELCGANWNRNPRTCAASIRDETPSGGRCIFHKVEVL